MSLEHLGQELRNQRQIRGISLSDIAAETRINIRFLEAMEEGKFAVLPQTYVRAFIREYASIVGLDPAVMMAKYDEARGEKPPTGPQHPGGKPLVQAGDEPTEQESILSDVQRKVVLGLLIVAAVAVAVFLLTSTGAPASTTGVQEIPFDRVVHESEAAIVKPDTNPAVATEPQAAAPVVVPSDSLRLEIETADSVWLSITSDSRRTEQYMLGPKRHKQWAAKDQFVISMGNAGGATFRLNGHEIGAIGKRGGIVRNHVINAGTIKAP